MRLDKCHNFHDFRELAKRRLPGPIFDYIDGGSDDEVTYRRNTASFERCDLVPGVLRGVASVDLSVTVMGQKLAVPFYCSPTALQRLFHHQGERAVAAAASKYETMFGVSSLGTVSLEELRTAYSTPQMYQFYFHRDRGLNRAMLQRAKQAGIEVMMLTVDSITGGNRERDLRSGFSIPFRLTLGGMLQFALKPMWGLNYVTHERFSLPQLDKHVDMGGNTISIGRYFTEMLDPSMNWSDVAEMVRDWNGQFCLKGVMSVEDAKRAAEIGCTGVVLSNHGGRQLDGSRSAFDQLAEIVDAVGDRLDVMIDKLGLSPEAFTERWNPEQWPRLRQLLTDTFVQRTRSEWCAVLEGSEACVAPVLDMDEALVHPHNVARNTFVRHAEVMQPAPAPRFSRTPAQIQRPAAVPGEHGEETLSDWGFDSDRIDLLKACGAL